MLDTIYSLIEKIPLPSIGINLLDVFIVGIVAFYAYEGYMLGLLIASVDLASFIISFVVALKGYVFVGNLLSQVFSIPRGFANALGFFLLALLTEIILNIVLRRLITKIPELPDGAVSRFFKKSDKYLGIIPGILSAFIIISFLLTVLMALPSSPFLKNVVSTSTLGSPLVANTAAFEERLNDIFGGALHETLNFITIRPGSTETHSLSFTYENPSVDPESEQRMWQMINEERKKRGLNPLVFDDSLRDLAREYSKDMLQRGYFSHYNLEGHSPFDRMDMAKINFLSAGENLALAASVNLAMDGLMRSPGHRANILSKNYNRVGIGVMDAGIYGKMFTQEFTD
jgi:uncharacterized protein YkwD